MKRTILLATMFACFAFGKASAQTINGVKLSDLKESYLEFNVFKQTMSSKLFVWLEYGQKVNNDRQAAIVKDDNGKNLEVSSAMDFIKRMKEYGYELFQAYAVAEGSDSVSKFYVLKLKD